MSFLRATFTIGAMTIISRLLGFVRDVLSANIMGAGLVADAFFVALKLPNFFRRMTAEGAFSVSFVPLFTRTLQEDGKDAAREFASQAMMWMSAILIPVSILAIIFMPHVIFLIAPGFDTDPERYALGVTLSRITFGYLFLMSLVALLGGILNTMDRFAPFAAAPIVFNAVMIVMLVFATPILPTAGHALAIGVLLAGILQFIWMAVHLYKLGFHIKLQRLQLTPKIKRLFKLMGPGIIGASAVQINLLVDIILASMLPIGAVSYLYYADRLNQLPLGLIGTAVGTALLPKLASKFTSNDHQGAAFLFNRALELTLLLTIPAATALAVMPHEIIAVLFERGAFTAHDTANTARALFAYALGLPAYVAIKIFATSLYAKEDTATPVKITVICVAFNTVLALLLIKPLGHVGLALATTVAAWLQLAIFMVLMLRQKHIGFDAALQKNIAKTVIVCVLMALVLIFTRMGVQGWIDETGLKRLIGVAIMMALGGGVFLAAMFGWRVVDLKQWRDYFIKG
ncbi:MAG TPA: murein biosynthesis integral membrane protein MurJ [Alphaproteobacteria bacterium]